MLIDRGCGVTEENSRHRGGAGQKVLPEERPFQCLFFFLIEVTLTQYKMYHLFYNKKILIKNFKSIFIGV